MEKTFDIFYVADGDIRFWGTDGVYDVTPRNGKWSYEGFIHKLSTAMPDLVLGYIDIDANKGYYVPVDYDMPMCIIPFKERRKIINYNVIIGNKTVAIIGKQAYEDIVADFPAFQTIYLPDGNK